MRIETEVGPQTLQDGSVTVPRLGKLGELLVTELHGKYYEQSYRGNVFHATMGATASITAVGTTSAFTLSNPAGSGKNLSVIRFRCGLTTLAGTVIAGTFGLFANTNVIAAAVTGTAVTPVNALLGGQAASIAKPFTIATLPSSPTLVIPVGGKISATLFGGVSSAYIDEDMDGTLLLAPGAAVSFMESVADTTSNFFGQASISWEEVPV